MPDATSYGVVFKSFEKVPYTNEYTYSVTPVAIVDKNFSLDELSQKKAENVGVKEVIFRSGEVVFVATCLVSIELTEYNMTATELAAAQKKSTIISTAKKALAANLAIPVNPEKYVVPGTKPLLHDKDFKILNLRSTGVLHRRPGKRMALDDAAVFTFALSADAVDIESQSGINKSYKLDFSLLDGGRFLASKFNRTTSRPNSSPASLQAAFSVAHRHCYFGPALRSGFLAGRYPPRHGKNACKRGKHHPEALNLLFANLKRLKSR